MQYLLLVACAACVSLQVAIFRNVLQGNKMEDPGFRALCDTEKKITYLSTFRAVGHGLPAVRCETNCDQFRQQLLSWGVRERSKPSGDPERNVFTKSNSSEEEKRNCIHSHSVQPYQTYISELLAWVSPLWNLHRQLLSWGARQSWGRWVQILNPETNNFSKSYSFEEEKQQWLFLLWLVSCKI